MAFVSQTYPPGEITPMGARLLMAGDEPMMAYRSFNDAIAWHLMGAMSPMPGVQNGVTIDGPKNLMPTWQTQDQQSANMDGVIYNGSVLDPIVIDVRAEAHGNSVAETRQVIRDWIASWSDKRQGELSFFTPDNGYWWAPARWIKTPTDALMRASSCRQPFTWTARIDSGCWRSFDSVSVFAPSYRDNADLFEVAYPHGLGPGWQLDYRGTGGGEIFCDGYDARWYDDVDHPFFTEGREVVCRRAGFTTVTDNQIVEITYGSIPEVTFPDKARNSLWARMPAAGTPGDTGVVAEIERHWVRLVAVVAGVRRVLAERPLLIPPLWGEKFTLIAGLEGDPRRFRITRGAGRFTLIDTREVGTFSPLGPAYRSVGMGMRAGSAIITQATPGRVRVWEAGDNHAVAQSGVLPLTNIGDQDEWYRLTVWGPGTFWFSNGPDATKWIRFGPLYDGQIVQIHTDIIRRGVVDFSNITASTDQLAQLQKSINELSLLAANNDLGPLLALFESAFGIIPPQGELYRLLSGRFSKPIPAKEPGKPAAETPLVVKVEGGGPSTKVVAALTPRRRWPL